jgi:hypothetical protein
MYAVTTNAVRDTSFMLTRSVNVYGGFSGNEIAVSQRDIANNITILSGEIADTNLVSDNCYHVLDIRNTVDTVRFDGLHITDGYADGPADMYGGGILISFSNRKPIVLRDCTINNNYAVQGSSIFNQGKVIIETSHISNEVLEGITGCSILNAGEMANMSLFNTTVVQQCANCPDVIQNINGATLIATEDVIVEKTE